jgi:hypothetical protein
MQFRSRNSDDLSFIERVSLFVSLYDEQKNSNNYSFSESESKGVMWRLSYPVSAYSYVLDNTPYRVPFWQGESYYPIIFKFIPRFIFPSKPSENMGQLFGHRYGILRREDFITSMNTPILAESYMNYSFLGSFIIFSILAIFLAFNFSSSNYKLASHSTVFFRLLDLMKVAFASSVIVQFESNLSLLIGKFIILFFFDKAIRVFIYKLS